MTYREPARPRERASDRGTGLLVALMFSGLLPVFGALFEGAAIDGAAGVGFLVALLALVLLVSEARLR